MIRPGPKDKKVSLLIAGDELAELKRLTWQMSEAFGLDRRIENYQGTRPILLYRWDFECLLAVVEDAAKDLKEYPDKSTSRSKAITSLADRLRHEYDEAFPQ